MKKIGTKFAIQIALGLIVVMTTFGGLDISQRRSKEIMVLQEKVERDLRQLSTFVGTLMFAMDYTTIETFITSYLLDPNVLAIKVLEGEQLVFYRGKTAESADIVDLAHISPQYANADTKQMEITYNAAPIGTLEVVFSRQAITAQVRQMIGSVITNLVLVLVFESLVVVWLVRNNISRPLQQLVHVFGQIAHGDMNVIVPEVSTRDEIGQLFGAIHTMMTALARMVTNVKLVSDQVAAGSQDMNASVSTMAHGAGEQATAAEQAAGAMEQMMSNIRQNADNAGRTKEIAAKAADDARKSGEALSEAVSAMQEIAKEIASIEDISTQTRMLSLNATIEAARAQDYGKGFAVVAAEVRTLAERSRAAASRITTLVDSGLGVAEKAGTMLNALVPDIQATSELVREISLASREQNAGAAQINNAIQQLDQVTQQNSATTEELSATAEVLAHQAEHLRETMTFFTIDEQAAEFKLEEETGT